MDKSTCEYVATEEEYGRFLNQSDHFHFVYLIDETKLDPNWKSFKKEIKEEISLNPNLPNYITSIIKTSSEEPWWWQNVGKEVENYHVSEEKVDFENLEKSLCKAKKFRSPDVNLVKNKKCNTRENLNILVDGGVELEKRTILEEAAMQIVESSTFEKINLNVIDSILHAREKLQTRLFKDCNALKSQLKSSYQLLEMTSDPNAAIKPSVFFLTNGERFEEIAKCRVAQRTFGDEDALMNCNSTVLTCRTFIIDEDLKPEMRSLISNSDPNMAIIGGEHINRKISEKIYNEYCNSRSCNDDNYEEPHHTCSFKENLNLIFTIDLSRQSSLYYKSHYTAIIQEVFRAFEFKWHPNNPDNKQLKSRLRVFGVNKPRSVLEKKLLFDTFYDEERSPTGVDFAVCDQNKTTLQLALETINVRVTNPDSSDLKGPTPEFNETISFLKTLYASEKRNYPNIKIVHLQDTSPDTLVPRAKGKPKASLPILVASSDMEFRKLAEKEDFETSIIIKNTPKCETSHLTDIFDNIWTTIKDINEFICEDQPVSYNQKSLQRCYEPIGTSKARFGLIEGMKMVGDCCVWSCKDNQISEFRVPSVECLQLKESELNSASCFLL
ncbi:Oidioi.mRNA.OKI2018_I69.chr2.g5033.t1.cds [Oikopleura dioica]|uniref:Oidioi.mRNA.OKI2018_I69.chr2.g5033.t1.cds n=1 Tax=Oikopleura dioica TaxID=34765 RepID=A0ABN7T2I2_OIKDI|nr:Oidioi.mRNA.OKI2018_I69.chr2.g5033.t1.cds [Oikopleura dioica]